MQFSVLISVYHREVPSYLSTSLQSIFNQTLVPSEVVLVKDGSLTPKLDLVIAKFVAMYPALKVVALPNNIGLGLALNEGLKHCSYELVARMDSDDICKPDRFEKQIVAFEQQEDVAVVGSWIDEFSVDPNIIESKRILPEYNEKLIEFTKYKSPLNHVTVMFRKSDIVDVGGYQHFYLLEDYWLWVRLIKAGKKIYNVQQSLVLVRGGVEMSARRGGLKYALSEIRLLKQMYSMGLISLFQLIQNSSIRFIVRMLPNCIRSFIYTKLLR